MVSKDSLILLRKSNFMQINIQRIIEIALLAGKEVMEVYKKDDFSSHIDFKADDSPLTLADKEANRVIMDELAKYYPEIPVLSEEGKHTDWEERKHWKQFFLVDPLDGTKEFIKRNGEFTVNIAFIDQQKTVAGVVYAPAIDVMYYGDKEKGAFKTENGSTNPIKVNNSITNRIAVGSRSHQAPEEGEVLKKYGVTEMVSMGSSLKFCLVAEGKADIYYRHNPTMEWDTAAGQAVLEAAGGTVLNAEGEVFAYNKPVLLNGSFLCKGF